MRDIWRSFVFKLEDVITENRTTYRTSAVDNLHRDFWQKTSLALNCFCLFFSINKVSELRQPFLKLRIVPSLIVKAWFTILSKPIMILWDHWILLHSTAFLQHLQKQNLKGFFWFGTSKVSTLHCKKPELSTYNI